MTTLSDIKRPPLIDTNRLILPIELLDHVRLVLPTITLIREEDQSTIEHILDIMDMALTELKRLQGGNAP